MFATLALPLSRLVGKDDIVHALEKLKWVAVLLFLAALHQVMHDVRGLLAFELNTCLVSLVLLACHDDL